MIKKNDWLVFAIFLVFAGGFFLWNQLSTREKNSALDLVIINIDGKLYESIPFDGREHSEHIITDKGFNDILIDSEGVRIIYADCSEQVCVNTGKISRPGEIMVCLPHRVTVTLKASANKGKDIKKGAVDAVAG